MKIDSFRDEYFFLSNFCDAPVTYDGLTCQNNEAAVLKEGNDWGDRIRGTVNGYGANRPGIFLMMPGVELKQ